MQNYPIHATPYNGTNNRKKTRGRIKADQTVQSIPIYEKIILQDIEFNGKLLGYRYITHY